MEKKYDDLKIILWLILFLVFGIIIITCKSQPGEYLMTVNGPVQPSAIGQTLTHEHILVDFIGADSIGYFRWNRDSVIARVLPAVLKAKDAGVNTFIECTPEYLGRDPRILKELSLKTGINFITNTGYYGAYNKYLPESLRTTDARALADKWTGEFLNGIEATGIKPGFIKISVNQDDTLSVTDTKIITAAALTHLNTGLTIVSHTGPEKPAFEQIDILKVLGVDPSAFIWVHAQRGTLESNIIAAKAGAWISLDNVRARPDAEPGAPYTIDWYAERIVEMKKNGLLHKVLISHDSGWYDPAKPGGGQINGYTDIFEYLIPVLKEKGITMNEINQLLSVNPAEAFKVRIRSLPD
jgi:phosphotriesterase-related protein